MQKWGLHEVLVKQQFEKHYGDFCNGQYSVAGSIKGLNLYDFF